MTEQRLASAPTTVTFVFSDVEGSTRLLNSLREAYGPLLDDYHDVIRGLLSHGGA